MASLPEDIEVDATGAFEDDAPHSAAKGASGLLELSEVTVAGEVESGAMGAAVVKEERVDTGAIRFAGLRSDMRSI